MRFTTAEIVVSAERVARPSRSPHPEALVYARIGAAERSLHRRLMESSAATYDPDLGVWRMQYATAVRLQLGRRLLLRRPKRSQRFGKPGGLGNSNIPAHTRLAISAHSRENRRQKE